MLNLQNTSSSNTLEDFYSYSYEENRKAVESFFMDPIFAAGFSMGPK
jgi:hypothetical protein